MIYSYINRVYNVTTSGFTLSLNQAPLSAGQYDRFYLSNDYFYVGDSATSASMVAELSTSASSVSITGLEAGMNYCMRAIRYDSSGGTIYQWGEASASPDPFRDGNYSYQAWTVASHEYIPCRLSSASLIQWDLSQPVGRGSLANWPGINVTQGIREYDNDFGGWTIGTKGGINAWVREYHGLYRPYLYLDPKKSWTVSFDIKLKRPISGWSVCIHNHEDYYTGIRNPNDLGQVTSAAKSGDILFWYQTDQNTSASYPILDDTKYNVKFQYLADTPSAGLCIINGLINDVIIQSTSATGLHMNLSLPVALWIVLLTNQSYYDPNFRSIATAPSASYVKMGNLTIDGDPCWCLRGSYRYEFYQGWFPRSDTDGGNDLHMAIPLPLDGFRAAVPGTYGGPNEVFHGAEHVGLCSENILPDYRWIYNVDADQFFYTYVGVNTPTYNFEQYGGNFQVTFGNTCGCQFHLSTPLITPTLNGKRYDKIYLDCLQGTTSGDYMKVYARYADGTLVPDNLLTVLSPAGRVGQVNSSGFQGDSYADFQAMIVSASAVPKLMYLDFQGNQVTSAYLDNGSTRTPQIRETWVTFVSDPSFQFFSDLAIDDIIISSLIETVTLSVHRFGIDDSYIPIILQNIALEIAQQPSSPIRYTNGQLTNAIIKKINGDNTGAVIKRYLNGTWQNV